MHKESYCENDNAVQHNNQTASEQTLSPDEGHVLHKVRSRVRMAILPSTGRTAAFDTDHQLYFCSASCESKFKAHPDRYLTEDASEHSHHHHHDHHEVSPDQIKQPHNRAEEILKVCGHVRCTRRYAAVVPEAVLSVEWHWSRS